MLLALHSRITIHHSPITIHIFSLVLAYRAVAQRRLVILIVILPRGTKPVPGTCLAFLSAENSPAPKAFGAGKIVS